MTVLISDSFTDTELKDPDKLRLWCAEHPAEGYEDPSELMAYLLEVDHARVEAGAKPMESEEFVMGYEMLKGMAKR